MNGARTGFLYDGMNPVQELSGTSVTANMLSGLGVDEYFTRTDARGTHTLLTDALGSTLALTDNAGTVPSAYTYEPYGRTTTTGTTNPNPFQYTGRENDGTSLYYYRARYYLPSTQRFISEDPLDFLGGDMNLYGYVGSNPINLIDPAGLKIDYGNYVITNLKVREALAKLNSLIESERANKSMVASMLPLASEFTIRITGGDRYLMSNGEACSLTNSVTTGGSSSPHLLERGARAVDFNVIGSGLSDADIRELMEEAGFQPKDIKSPQHYPEGPHYHGSLLNTKSNAGPYSNVDEYLYRILP